MMMTLNDVAEVCGVSPNSLNDWIQNGFIEPAEQLGEGRGKGHRFSTAQAVALMYGVNLKKLGAGRPMVRAAVALIAAQGEAGLRAALADGRRVWWPGMGLTCVPPGVEVPRLIDLADVYRIVTNRFSHLEKVRAKGAKTGARPKQPAAA